MAAGHAVKSKAGGRTICLTDFYARGKAFICLSVPHFQLELVRNRNKRRDKVFQFPRNWAAVQIELQQQRPFHAGKHGIQLLSHFCSKQFVAVCRSLRFHGNGWAAFLWGGRLGTDTGLSLHCRHIFLQFRGCQCSVTGGCHHLTQRLDAHIPRRVDTFCAGLLRCIR